VDKNFGPILNRLWTELCKIWSDVGDTTCTFQSHCPIVHVTFHSKDIRH